MQIYDIILIGIALSMDAMALTIANCTTYKNSITPKKEWAMPALFSFFQGLMPLLGFLIGSIFAGVIGNAADFISAGIFFVLAVKIVFDLLKERQLECTIKDGKKECKKTQITYTVLILQALATSIDAFAVGITFINLSFSIFIAVAIIVLVTFAIVSCGLFIGKKLGSLFGEYAEWVGAIILFVLAVKSLIQAFI